MLFRFGKSPSSLCSFCKLHDESLTYLFSGRNEAISVRIEIINFRISTLLSAQIATFGLVKGNDKSFLVKNMILMVSKLYVYKSRVSGKLNFNAFLHQLVKVKNLEKGAVNKNAINKTNKNATCF